MGDRYTRFAPFYNLLSGEYPIYHSGRVLGITALASGNGQQVLDIGCGTGLNFALLQQSVGASGTIIGIDRSAAMLHQARRRVENHRWDNVILLQADMALTDPETLSTRIQEAGGSALSGAALATYSLSLMNDWQRAWKTMTALLDTHGRVCVVDMADPLGGARWLTPLARLACALGGSNIHAAPWRALEEQCADVVRGSARAGHLQIRSGTTLPLHNE
ncbi:class I SAM-dependent methyltransferase [Arthrobacter cryoconiti]|uniref:Class I SAM-dependent methyltransferase n=1 Tax=Arthrobacter cryoconiti TaxID=748907 RepID=A0ABV8QW38_9MICC|nr:methyltransferase domain-containing protein [Arthrobacter cryoconiti]MCC9069697.1 methyltransferase domain-containing protein [Arthrobacter cryoconiti]